MAAVVMQWLIVVPPQWSQRDMGYEKAMVIKQ